MGYTVGERVQTFKLICTQSSVTQSRGIHGIRYQDTRGIIRKRRYGAIITADGQTIESSYGENPTNVAVIWYRYATVADSTSWWTCKGEFSNEEEIDRRGRCTSTTSRYGIFEQWRTIRLHKQWRMWDLEQFVTCSGLENTRKTTATKQMVSVQELLKCFRKNKKEILR